jgi:hypothetical protein
MYRLLTPIILCLVAHTAAAQCVAAAPPAATAAATSARKGAELITTAAAGTRDAPSMHKVSTAAGRAQATDDEHPRRTGPAMLFTALAIMSAIALRRIGMPRQ